MRNCYAAVLKIQSFLLQRRVSYWKASCIIITKGHLVSIAGEIIADGLRSRPALSWLWERSFKKVNDIEEMRAKSSATIHGFSGPLFPSKGNCLHFGGFLQGKLPRPGRGQKYI